MGARLLVCIVLCYGLNCVSAERTRAEQKLSDVPTSTLLEELRARAVKSSVNLQSKETDDVGPMKEIFKIAPRRRPELEKFMFRELHAEYETRIMYIQGIDGVGPKDDDRVEMYEVSSQTERDLGKSIALLVSSAHLTNLGATSLLTAYETVDKVRPKLCSTEKFRAQKVAGFCTGFLINKSTILTAGHCLKNKVTGKALKVTNIRFVFDWAIQNDGSQYFEIKESNIRSGKKMLGCGNCENAESLDWAVIEMNSPKHGETISVSNGEDMAKDTPVFTIAHHSGLPQKYTPGGKVLQSSSDSFLTSLDAFRRASGAPVFNASSGQLEGILVQATRDYDLHSYNRPNDCYVAAYCAGVDCQRGAKVTKISAIPRDILNVAK